MFLELLLLVFKDFARVFLPVTVLLESQKASELQATHSRHDFAFARPEG